MPFLNVVPLVAKKAGMYELRFSQVYKNVSDFKKPTAKSKSSSSAYASVLANKVLNFCSWGVLWFFSSVVLECSSSCKSSIKSRILCSMSCIRESGSRLVGCPSEVLTVTALPVRISMNLCSMSRCSSGSAFTRLNRLSVFNMVSVARLIVMLSGRSLMSARRLR